MEVPAVPGRKRNRMGLCFCCCLLGVSQEMFVLLPFRVLLGYLCSKNGICDYAVKTVLLKPIIRCNKPVLNVCYPLQYPHGIRSEFQDSVIALCRWDPCITDIMSLTTSHNLHSRLSVRGNTLVFQTDFSYPSFLLLCWGTLMWIPSVIFYCFLTEQFVCLSLTWSQVSRGQAVACGPF